MLRIVFLSILTMIFSRSFAQTASKTAMIWEVKTANSGKVFIGGVLRFSPEKMEIPLTFHQAFEQADLIVFDENPEESRYEFQRLYTEKGFYEADETIADHLSEDLYVQLEKRLKDLNLPLGHIPRTKPWLAAHSFAQAEIEKAGFEMANLKDYFLQQAKTSGKKIMALPKSVSLPFLLSEMNQDDQIDYLKYRLTISPVKTEQIPLIYKAWENGDLMGLNQYYLKENQALSPHLKELLQKNHMNFSALKKMMKSDKNVFILLDMNHFLDEESILKSFEESGIELERI